MNLAQLRSTFTQHRTALAAGGAGLVALLALWRHHQAASAPASPTDASNADGTAATTSAADNTASGYNSSPYDVYNSIESQLEALQQQINQPAAPVPTTAPTPTPTGPTPQIYHVLSPGWLTSFNHNGQVPPAPPAKAPVVRGTNL